MLLDLFCSLPSLPLRWRRTYSGILRRSTCRATCPPSSASCAARWPRPGTDSGKEKLKKEMTSLKPLITISVADPGCLFRIPNPGSDFFPSRIPNPNFFHPGSASNNLSNLTQKMVSKFYKIWSRLFIPDPDPDFLPIPDPELQHW